jgi:hypothetical protein
MSASTRDYKAIAAAIASENERWRTEPPAKGGRVGKRVAIPILAADLELILTLEAKRTLLAMKVADALQSTNFNFHKEEFLAACDLTDRENEQCVTKIG